MIGGGRFSAGIILSAAVSAGGFIGFISPAIAAETGQSVYLLGSAGSMAGFVPPPGSYFADLNYYYTGSAQGTAAAGIAERQVGVSLNLKVDGQAYYQIPTAILVTQTQVLGGNLGFSLAAPIGWKDVRVDALATITPPPPFPPLAKGAALDDQNAGFGDPIATAFVGWHDGNWHWKVTGLVNIPIGEWDSDRLSNIGFNHWAFDISGAVTWLDPKSGVELSAATGFTFNTENYATNYTSGTDFHIEYAAMQNFSKQFAIGVTGYYYQQITGDSGSGAVLGAFEGRAAAIGPQINYNFQLGMIPVNTSLKYLHEFDVQNRLKGDMGFFTALIPLSAAPPLESMK